MKTSRQRVLEYIQTHQAVTTADLCQALGGTEANMRHHLAVLLEQGAVRVIDAHPVGEGRPAGKHRRRPAETAAAPAQSARRGRPRRIFGPVDPAPAAGLETLAEALLDEILAGQPPEAGEAVLQRLALRLAGRMAAPAAERPAPQANRPAENTPASMAALTRRLFSAIERLNAAHYKARWEARPDGPRILLGRCPYGDLPMRRPEVCRLDAHLLAQLTGGSVEQIKRLETDGRGAALCVFRISKPGL